MNLTNIINKLNSDKQFKTAELPNENILISFKE